MSGDFSRQVRAVLTPLAEPQKASGMAAYMKNHFVFLGLQTPVRRAAVKPLLAGFSGDLAQVARELWQEPEREFQYVGCDLLRQRGLELGGAGLGLIEELAARKSWWDSVDSLAVVAGELAAAYPALCERLDELIGSDNFWLRRLSLLHQLNYKEKTDQARLFAACLRLAAEKEFFIRKAIGWALRQYARVNPQAVRDFVRVNSAALSPLSRREALKHL